MAVYCLGLGVATKSSQGDILEVYYHSPKLNPSGSWVDQILKKVSANATSVHELEFSDAADIAKLIPGHPQLEGSKQSFILSLVFKDEAPQSVPEAYLKLHLLSHRLVKPHGTNITGVFKVLPNVAWTNEGAISIGDLPARQLKSRLNGATLAVNCVDKFPRMTDYVVPSGVRIAHTARVRLGAYVGEGSTIMHEGFINFNAGCEGPNMIEGRISAGVMVSQGSDLGGGCSTMGTLSGGNDVVIAIGKNCLIGANAGCGIPLGNNCTIEAGLYVTGGSKVRILDKAGKETKVVKAGSLAGVGDILFRRNSLDGAIECKPLKAAIVLNDELHSNN
jgi:2,3,4,5-tetrahydropyridine-2,6-dicarboxylate N-succinyltransferase